MRALYPEIHPFNSHSIVVGEHSIYYEESGNRQGVPVVFIHGGPGSGSNANHRRYFNPEFYRIINFDQRGCHRSTPVGCVENNTTDELLEDLERIRSSLGIDKWLLFGGSWGATLALLYAQAFPERVTGLILRGCFLARKADLDWFIQGGASKLFPDYWEDFLAVLAEDERDNIVSAYHSRLHGEDKKEQQRAAMAWSTWAGRIVTHTLESVDGDTYKPEDPEQTIKEVKIETHYARHAYFIAENQILQDVSKLPDVPFKIIHGRRDLTCTLESSWLLHRAIQGSELSIIKDGGHLAGETVMVDALVRATDDMAELLS